MTQYRVGVFNEEGNFVFGNYNSTVSEKQALVISYESPISKLTSLSSVSRRQLMASAWHINVLMIVIMVLSVFLAALAAGIFSRAFLSNINRFQESMLRIRDGYMDVRSKIVSRDEIGVMSGIFDNMMDRIELLMKDIREKEEQKRGAEQAVLEAQIHPHFIYNTINSISYVAHMRGEKELEAVSSATVLLLRGILGERDSFIPLWQEYNYIEQYLVIHRFKTQQNFKVDYDVEEKLWQYRIPKLILQPIVENALIHGISRMEDGKVIVQVFRHKDTLVIKVTDNGKGFKQEADNEKTEVTSERTMVSFRRIGLDNVRERIALVYGSDYGVKISSTPGVFTTVEITLPFLEEKLCAAF